jgi:hypothetical protein
MRISFHNLWLYKHFTQLLLDFHSIDELMKCDEQNEIKGTVY